MLIANVGEKITSIAFCTKNGWTERYSGIHTCVPTKRGSGTEIYLPDSTMKWFFLPKYGVHLAFEAVTRLQGEAFELKNVMPSKYFENM